jgi:transcriptional regulator NrdR family protein
MRALAGQPIVTTGQLTSEMLKALRAADDIAYLRYASVAKQFSSEGDYEAEALSLANERRSSAP